MVWFIQTWNKQVNKRITVFQYEILPYSPLPFPLINHFNQIKCHIVFRLVFFVLLFQNVSVNILVKHSPRGNSKQTILVFSQKCLLLTNHLLTSVHNQILTDLNLHFPRSTVFKQKSVQPWTAAALQPLEEWDLFPLFLTFSTKKSPVLSSMHQTWVLPAWKFIFIGQCKDWPAECSQSLLEVLETSWTFLNHVAYLT